MANQKRIITAAEQARKTERTSLGLFNLPIVERWFQDGSIPCDKLVAGCLSGLQFWLAYADEILVVDANGSPNSYATVAEAMAVATATDVIVLLSDTTETGNFELSVPIYGIGVRGIDAGGNDISVTGNCLLHSVAITNCGTVDLTAGRNKGLTIGPLASISALAADLAKIITLHAGAIFVCPTITARDGFGIDFRGGGSVQATSLITIDVGVGFEVQGNGGEIIADVAMDHTGTFATEWIGGFFNGDINNSNATGYAVNWQNVIHTNGAISNFTIGTKLNNYTNTQNDTQVGRGGFPLTVYTDISRPAANSVAVGSVIWNSDDNAPNYSDGSDWRDAAGVIT